jgi:hypothetical protein
VRNHKILKKRGIEIHKFVVIQRTVMSQIIKRYYILEEHLKKGKVLIVYGARQVGKTTLVKDFLSRTTLKYKFDSGDNIRTQQALGSQNFNDILDYAEGYELLVIDEAQQIKNIGMGLKILVDNKPELRVLVTGSSSFDLSQQVGEPLTGRKRTLILYPFANLELKELYNEYELKNYLQDFMIYGSYPEVIKAQSTKEKVDVLKELVNSYLLKDVLSLEKIRGSKQLLDLLKLLAFQIGNQISLTELATQVNLDVKTVQRYLDILEKAFIIKKIGSFSRNLRKEITSKAKYYFIDNGIRNGVILQFNKLEDRNDAGKLFENFIMMERIKANDYLSRYCNSYFWRTYDQKEIDLIEEREGKLFAYEIKWAEGKRFVPPKDWKDAYPDSEFNLITSSSYTEFILK